MKRIISMALAATGFTMAYAQISTLSNNKPLGYLNPAFQNYESDKGVISVSGLLNPLAKEEVPLAYLAIGEYNVSKDFRVGIHSSSVENRLSSSTSTMVYGSYRLQLDKGNYLSIGLDVGRYSYSVKNAEFNRVLAPNKFTFGEDSSSIGETAGLDFGIGFAYAYNGFFGGVDISKANNPSAYPFPVSFFEKAYTNTTPIDSFARLQDTTVNFKEGSFGVEVGINLLYNWNFSKDLSITHSVHAANISGGGIDYIALQNFAEIRDRHSIGVGIFHNGSTGFIASAGYGFTEKIKLEVTSFFIDDLNFNDQTKVYESDGYKPTLEANLRFEF